MGEGFEKVTNFFIQILVWTFIHVEVGSKVQTVQSSKDLSCLVPLDAICQEMEPRIGDVIGRWIACYQTY